MTHKDIYTKFMIEYDKAGASTSYPSLTEYEVATVLDKAYNALIAQKVTGNNVRRATFESDIKSIADLGPLVNTAVLIGEQDVSVAPNIYKFDIQKKVDHYDHYFFLDDHEVSGILTSDMHISVDGETELDHGLAAYWHEQYHRFVFYDELQDPEYAYIYCEDESDQTWLAEMTDAIVNNDYVYFNAKGGGYYLFDRAQNSMTKVENFGNDIPVFIDPNLLYFLQGSMLYNSPTSLQDSNNNDHFFTAFNIETANDYKPVDNFTTGRGVPVKLVNHEIAQKFFTSASNIPWIKEPVCFIEGTNLFVVYDPLNPPTQSFRMTYIKQPNTFVKDLTDTTTFPSGTWTYFNPSVSATDAQKALYEFECNSTVAEELVSLAVAFALENVESQRLNSKLNMRGLEA